MSQQSELELMINGMSDECKQSIRDKADKLEVYFSDDVVFMKDKDEEWIDSMLYGLKESNLTKLNKQNK